MAGDSLPIKQIVRMTGLSRNLVRQILRGEREDAFRLRQSSLEPWLPWLTREWESGCRNGAELWHRLRAKGFGGSLRVAGEWATRQRRAEASAYAAPGRCPSARRIAVPRPAIPGARAMDRTAARPASSLQPPSTPATTCAPARTVRPPHICPRGTLVAFTGGKDFDDVTAIWRSLDSIKIKYDDMVLLHGGGPGAEKIAASWAEKNGVHQVVCKPNWDRDGKAAPFRRNDVLLNFLPKGLVAFPGSGITNNMIDKARKIGIPVLLAAA